MLLFFSDSLACRKTERVIRLTQSAVEATFAIIPGNGAVNMGIMSGEMIIKYVGLLLAQLKADRFVPVSQ